MQKQSKTQNKKQSKTKNKTKKKNTKAKQNKQNKKQNKTKTLQLWNSMFHTTIPGKASIFIWTEQNIAATWIWDTAAHHWKKECERQLNPSGPLSSCLMAESSQQADINQVSGFLHFSCSTHSMKEQW